ncbi:hypothetical protein Tco_0302748 [Tanacetum coccineum]
MMRPNHQDLNALDNMKPWKRYCSHKFIMSSFYGKDATEMRSLEIDDMLRIKLREAKSNEEIFTSVVWIRAFNINEPIYAELFHEFNSTYDVGNYRFDETKETSGNIINTDHIDLRLNGNIARKSRVLTDDVIRSLKTPIYCRDLDTTSLRDLINFVGRLIPRGSILGVLGWYFLDSDGIMQDLYDRLGRMEGYATVAMSGRRLGSHITRTGQRSVENMAGVYSVPLQGAYNQPIYAQPQYDQYYQQYPPPPPQ